MNLTLHQRRGFSLLEMVVVVAVTGLLAAMIFLGYKSVERRAKKVTCISQMRAIHNSFMAYMEDKGHWPQYFESEESQQEWSEDNFYGFFARTLEPYGSNKELWLCPADEVYRDLSKQQKKKHYGSYVPTPFDKVSGTPFRWNQPWLIERGDYHGNGGHLLMPDGSIQEGQNPFYGR